MVIYNALQGNIGNFKFHKGEIGLEIETESPTEYKIPKFAFWDVHTDGSLRQVGREYVLKVPVMFEKELPEALTEFKEKTEGIPFIQDSITTSVHVHMNILNETFVTLGNVLATYALVENLLIRFSGPDRRSNLFSLPMCDAEEIYNNIIRLVIGMGTKRYGHMAYDVESTKYGALNLSSIARYGSLEIRSFRGVTDIDVIYQWVGLLYSIMQYARQEKLTPPQIIMAYKEKGAEILSDIFSSDQRQLIAQKNEVDLLEKNFWYSANIASAIKNWDKLEIDVPKKSKSKDLEKLAQAMYGVRFEQLDSDAQMSVINADVHEVEHHERARRGGLQEATLIYNELAGINTNTWRRTTTGNDEGPTPIRDDE